METPPFFRSIYFPILVTVALVQSVHMGEHAIQLAQVHLFGVADADALGVLGYVFEFQGTEEWLHLGFNLSFLLALYVLAPPLRGITPTLLPSWAFAAFVALGLGLESWHMVEHIVIISHVIANSGCPCPGIGDSALGLTDTVLHFVYNAGATAGILLPAWFLWSARPDGAGPGAVAPA